MDLFLLYQFVVLAILLLLFINFLVNNILLKDISRYGKSFFAKDDAPLVSVLIPARNEEKNISRCLKMILKQDYPNFEVIVLDDNSVDKTYEIVNGYRMKDQRVKLYKGGPLIKGWMGKNYACHQLSKYANGKYLIFTDADTLHVGNSISHSLNSLIANKLDALSVYPKQIMVTIHERMSVSFISFAILLFMPLILVKKTKNPLFATAIGQFFLFKRKAYFDMGGHESVKSEILEDIHISKRVKKAGYRFMVFDGKRDIYCRMYKNLKEVIVGFNRFIFSAFDFNTTMICICFIFLLLLFLMPFIYLPLGFFLLGWDGMPVNLLIYQIIIILVIRTMLAIRFRSKVYDILLHPLMMVYIFALAFSSVMHSKSGLGVLWKDRSYDCKSRKEIEDPIKTDDMIEGYLSFGVNRSFTLTFQLTIKFLAMLFLRFIYFGIIMMISSKDISKKM
jgi:chlorobactene glucosyltransferase